MSAAYRQFIIYATAIAVALAITLSPVPVQSGVYTSGGPVTKQPRWSNDHQLRNAAQVHPDCIAPPFGLGADYVPGVDAWGKPVIPAESHPGFQPPFPMGVDLDVKLGKKRVGGKTIELYGGDLTYDPYVDQLALNGHVWSRDCLPPQK